MSRYLVEQNLRDGSLLPITGKHLRGGQVDLVAARGPIANRLWQHIADQAAEIIPA